MDIGKVGASSAPTTAMGQGMTSATVSLSLLAGFTFGFIYLVLTGIKWASGRLEGGDGAVEKGRCARCGSSFLDVEDGKCSLCERIVCAHCAIQYPQSWVCTACISTTDETLNATKWVLSRFKQRFQFTVSELRKYGSEYDPRYSVLNEKLSTFNCKIDDHSASLAFNQLESIQFDKGRSNDVRDFVERLTESVVGGKLDDVRIDRLSDHPDYLRLMEKYEDVLSLTLSRLLTSVQMIVDGVTGPKNESPRVIHSQLKQLISQIYDEISAVKLEKSIAARINSLRTKTYEDILATAVLNKIIQDYLKNALDKRRTNDVESVWKDFSCDDAENNNKLALGELINNSIRNHNNVNNGQNSYFDLEDEFEDLFGEIEKTPLWKDNWVLEKKKKESSVTMLIPSPNGNIRPRIGETEVDELSDLSDTDIEPTPMLDVDDVAFKTRSDSDYYTNSLTNGFSDDDSPSRKGSSPDSLLETRNPLFENSMLDPSKVAVIYLETEKDCQSSNDRDFPEMMQRNPTRININFQTYADNARKYDVEDPKVNVKQLAKHFSNNDFVLHPKKSIHSLTCRNPSRDQLTKSSINGWERSKSE